MFRADETEMGRSQSYETATGKMYCGLSEVLLQDPGFDEYKGSVQLVLTSPPFPLNRKKSYGNRTGADYTEWFAGFAPLLSGLLTENGSIVVELGNAWEQGHPTMSLLPLKTLLAFLERGGLHLCQEFICFNPARLPTPAQWVTVERIRVKDAYTRAWWMSPIRRPKADNARVLTAYSKSMRKLLERGTYNPGRRPSGHNISESGFLKRHSGAIPPSVLIPQMEEILEASTLLPQSNTGSCDPYQDYCRSNNVPLHPARMPLRTAEFFISFLTDPDDLVLDPFAGSNTTGAVAEMLGRRWLSIEAVEDYVTASKAWFQQSGTLPLSTAT